MYSGKLEKQRFAGTSRGCNKNIAKVMAATNSLFTLRNYLGNNLAL